MLRYAARPAAVTADLATAGHSALIGATADGDGLPELIFGGPGRVTTAVTVPTSGVYTLWMGAEIGSRPLHVSVDGRSAGSASTQTGGDGNMVDIGAVLLSAGRHTITVVRPGGGWGPGDAAPTVIDGIYLQRIGLADETVKVLTPTRWKTLCGRLLDWVEVT